MKGSRTPLHVLRAERRITQARLLLKIATLLPKGRTMSQGRYSQIESGDSIATSDDKRAIATALGVKVSDIDWPEVGARASA